jgi:hypothetical protein
MTNQHHGTILRRDNALGRGDVVGQGHGGMLHDGDCISLFLQGVVDALPT